MSPTRTISPPNLPADLPADLPANHDAELAAELRRLQREEQIVRDRDRQVELTQQRERARYD